MKRIALGILAHVDSGKTTLSEALLYISGRIRTLGRVDHKNTYLDTNAVEQAAANVAASPWSKRIQVMETDVKHFEGFPFFDAILCNPPFFENSLKSPDAARSMARHTDTLSFDELAQCASRLLTREGELSVVIPYDRTTDMTVSAACNGLFATRQTVVVPVEGGRPKRMLMAFTRQGAAHGIEVLCLQNAQRSYTQDYIRLVKDFYLKM